MSSLNSLYLPELKNWQDFQNLCRDLWSKIWNDPNAKINGREGYKQHGVDIYGRLNGKNEIVGIQCKIKDKYADKKLSESEVKEEIEKAKKFEPKLNQYIIATTGPHDGKLDELERKITDEHIKLGLFTVHIVYWDEIISKLSDNVDLIVKYFPVIGESILRIADKLKQDEEKYNKIINSQTLNPTVEIEVAQSLKQKTEDLNLVSQEVDPSKNTLHQEFNKEIDFARDLILGFNLLDGIAILENLKIRIWDKIDDKIKCRIITNIAAAKMQLDTEERKMGAQLIVEALQYNKNDNKAILNAALGYIELGELKKANELVASVLLNDTNNPKAYAIKIQTFDVAVPFEDILKEIPDNIKLNSEVALAIGNSARKRKNLIEAEKWFEIAEQNNDDNSIEFKGLFAETLLEIATSDRFSVLTKQIDEIIRKKLEKALSLLNEVCTLMNEKKVIKYHPTYLFNRGVVKQLLGDINGAVKDMDDGINLVPYDVFIKHRALLAIDMHDEEKAIDLLKGVIEKTDKVDIHLMLAEIEIKRENYNEAEIIINNLLKNEIEEMWKAESYLLLARIFKKLKKFERILEIANELMGDNFKNLLSKIYALRMFEMIDDKEKSSETIAIIESLINEKTIKIDKLAFADELYSLSYFDQALKYYSQIVDVNINNALTYRLIACYYQTGDYGKTLELCKKLREKYGIIPDITEIEVGIYERIGDLKSAIKTYEEYLKKHLNDLYMELRFITVNFRAEKFDVVDAFLQKGFKTEQLSRLSINALFQISFLYRERKMYKESLKIIYEIRRNNYNDPYVHANYIKIFFSIQDKLKDFLSPKIVGLDAAVSIGTDKDNDWYIIEDRDDIKFENKELYYSHELAKQMIGKKKGENFYREVGMGKGVELQIIDIQSKYVHAYLQSLTFMGKLFPDQEGISIIPYKNDEEAVKWILNNVNELSEFIKKAKLFYKEGKLTIGGLSKFINRNIITVWMLLVTSSEIGIKYCLGTSDERDTTLNILRKHNKIVLDLISILTIKYLEIEQKIIKSFKIIISQKIIDKLKEIQSELKNVKIMGFKSLYKVDNNFALADIKTEDVEKEVVKIDNLINWLEINCSIEPCKKSLEINAKRKEEFDEAIGEEFLDSLLLAGEVKGIFYSDDLKLRTFAKKEFGVEGIWTQILLQYLLEKEQITIDEYNKYIIKLICANYYYTSINGLILIEAARQSNWEPVEPFNSVVRILNGKFSDRNDSLFVAINFLSELWKEPLLEMQFTSLVMKLIDDLTAGRNSKEILRLLITGIKSKFVLLPFVEMRILNAIKNWRRMHPL